MARTPPTGAAYSGTSIEVAPASTGAASKRLRSYAGNAPRKRADDEVRVAKAAFQSVVTPETRRKDDENAARATRPAVIAQKKDEQVTGDSPASPLNSRTRLLPPPEPSKSFRDLTFDGQACPQCPEMVVVPAGRFLMGAAPGDPGEGPQRQVTIQQPFAIGKYKITFDEWSACIVAGGCARLSPPAGKERNKGKLPADNMSWYEAKGYVAWLSQKTGMNYRLLTEAQWEYVAREGRTTPLSSKQQIPFDKFDNLLRQRLAVVSTKPNKFGLHNVLQEAAGEWVEDCWHDTLKEVPSDGSAGTFCWEDSRRVIRGKYYAIGSYGYRQFDRSWRQPRNTDNNLGFRVARTLE